MMIVRDRRVNLSRREQPTIKTNLPINESSQLLEQSVFLENYYRAHLKNLL